MRERVSYNDYYDKDREYVYENRKGISMFKVCLTVAGAGVVGYVLGYKKARATSKGVLDTIFEKFPDHKSAFKKVWNEAVDEYFDRK